MTKSKILAGLTAALLFVGLSACTSAADRANENLSKAAENFEVPRRIVGINGITDNVLFTVEGFCSYEVDGGTYEVICKQPDGQIERTAMAKSDNVTIIVTGAVTMESIVPLLEKHFGDRGIRVSVVCPAFFRTDRSDRVSYSAANSTFTPRRWKRGSRTMTRPPRNSVSIVLFYKLSPDFCKLPTGMYL